MMRVIAQSGYGSPDRLALLEFDAPLIEDHRVLVRVCASSQNGGNDVRALDGGRAR